MNNCQLAWQGVAGVASTGFFFLYATLASTTELDGPSGTPPSTTTSYKRGAAAIASAYRLLQKQQSRGFVLGYDNLVGELQSAPAVGCEQRSSSGTHAQQPQLKQGNTTTKAAQKMSCPSPSPKKGKRSGYSQIHSGANRTPSPIPHEHKTSAGKKVASPSPTKPKGKPVKRHTVNIHVQDSNAPLGVHELNMLNAIMATTSTAHHAHSAHPSQPHIASASSTASTVAHLLAAVAGSVTATTITTASPAPPQPLAAHASTAEEEERLHQELMAGTSLRPHAHSLNGVLGSGGEVLDEAGLDEAIKKLDQMLGLTSSCPVTVPNGAPAAAAAAAAPGCEGTSSIAAATNTTTTNSTVAAATSSSSLSKVLPGSEAHVNGNQGSLPSLCPSYNCAPFAQSCKLAAVGIDELAVSTAKRRQGPQGRMLRSTVSARSASRGSGGRSAGLSRFRDVTFPPSDQLAGGGGGLRRPQSYLKLQQQQLQLQQALETSQEGSAAQHRPTLETIFDRTSAAHPTGSQPETHTTESCAAQRPSSQKSLSCPGGTFPAKGGETPSTLDTASGQRCPAPPSPGLPFLVRMHTASATQSKWPMATKGGTSSSASRHSHTPSHARSVSHNPITDTHQQQQPYHARLMQSHSTNGDMLSGSAPAPPRAPAPAPLPKPQTVAEAEQHVATAESPGDGTLVDSAQHPLPPLPQPPPDAAPPKKVQPPWWMACFMPCAAALTGDDQDGLAGSAAPAPPTRAPHPSEAGAEGEVGSEAASTSAAASVGSELRAADTQALAVVPVPFSRNCTPRDHGPVAAETGTGPGAGWVAAMPTAPLAAAAAAAVAAPSGSPPPATAAVPCQGRNTARGRSSSMPEGPGYRQMLARNVEDPPAGAASRVSGAGTSGTRASAVESRSAAGSLSPGTAVVSGGGGGAAALQLPQVRSLEGLTLTEVLATLQDVLLPATGVAVPASAGAPASSSSSSLSAGTGPSSTSATGATAHTATRGQRAGVSEALAHSREGMGSSRLRIAHGLSPLQGPGGVSAHALGVAAAGVHKGPHRRRSSRSSAGSNEAAPAPRKAPAPQKAASLPLPPPPAARANFTIPTALAAAAMAAPGPSKTRQGSGSGSKGSTWRPGGSPSPRGAYYELHSAGTPPTALAPAPAAQPNPSHRRPPPTPSPRHSPRGRPVAALACPPSTVSRVQLAVHGTNSPRSRRALFSPRISGPASAAVMAVLKDEEAVGDASASPRTASPRTASPRTASPRTASPRTASPRTATPAPPASVAVDPRPDTPTGAATTHAPHSMGPPTAQPQLPGTPAVHDLGTAVVSSSFRVLGEASPSPRGSATMRGGTQPLGVSTSAALLPSVGPIPASPLPRLLHSSPAAVGTTVCTEPGAKAQGHSVSVMVYAHDGSHGGRPLDDGVVETVLPQSCCPESGSVDGGPCLGVFSEGEADGDRPCQPDTAHSLDRGHPGGVGVASAARMPQQTRPSSASSADSRGQADMALQASRPHSTGIGGSLGAEGPGVCLVLCSGGGGAEPANAADVLLRPTRNTYSMAGWEAEAGPKLEFDACISLRPSAGYAPPVELEVVVDDHHHNHVTATSSSGSSCNGAAVDTPAHQTAAPEPCTTPKAINTGARGSFTSTHASPLRTPCTTPPPCDAAGTPSRPLSSQRIKAALHPLVRMSRRASSDWSRRGLAKYEQTLTHVQHLLEEEDKELALSGAASPARTVGAGMGAGAAAFAMGDEDDGHVGCAPVEVGARPQKAALAVLEEGEEGGVRVQSVSGSPLLLSHTSEASDCEVEEGPLFSAFTLNLA